MLRQLRRQLKKLSSQKHSVSRQDVANLRLEPLESRVLLDVSGYWAELGYRSATGGGVTWNNGDMAEANLVLT